MSELLDGATVPWDFVSGPTNPALKADAVVWEAVRRRRTDAAARAAQRAEWTEEVRRGTQAIAAAGISARDLSRHIATNLRRLTTPEETP